jgi:hypothetical protein
MFTKGRALWKGIKGDEWALLIRLINVTLHRSFIFTIISKVIYKSKSVISNVRHIKSYKFNH